jgi:Protein of unknown function (DUF3105)
VSAAAAARRDRKEEARRQREEALKRMRRAAIIRRVVIIGLVLAVVAGAVIFFYYRGQADQRAQNQARDVAEAAGCTQVVTRPDFGANHVAAPEPINYTEQPPTSGPHRPNTLDPGTSVYQTEPDITSAVHNLEHAYVIIWYREGAVDEEMVAQIEHFAEITDKTIAAPFGQLPEGTDIAITAWRKIQECPGDLSGEDLEILLDAFSRFERDLAPEPTAA